MNINKDRKESNQEVSLDLKEKYYRRNFITMLMESFFFSFAMAVFSPESILPSYVKMLSDDPIYITILSTLYYILISVCAFFSCTIGVNAKSPKWTNVIVCLFQRLGFLFIFLSTFMIKGDIRVTMAVFMTAFSINAISGGMSNPLFNSMIGNIIPHGLGKFYGAYSFVGALSGVFASLLLTKYLNTLAFPYSYRKIFFLGFLLALVASLVVMIGVKEVKPEKSNTVRMRYRDVIPQFRKILKENKIFRSFVAIRVLLCITDFAIPYYIVAVSEMPGLKDGFVGIMSAAYLLTKMISSLIWGRVIDRKGILIAVRWMCICGFLATVFVILFRSWILMIVMYVLLGAAVNGVFIVNSTACIQYAGKDSPTILYALDSLLCAPFYLATAFGSTALVKTFGMTAIFVLAMSGYLASGILTCRPKIKENQNN